MIDIYLSINNREEVIQLPVVPSEFQIASASNHQTFTTVNQGDLRMLGKRGLSAMSLASFFPKQDYPWLRSRQYTGWEYIEKIEAWRDRERPIRLIITGTPVNMAMTIDSFEYGVQDGSGDIYYTLALTEYRFINLPKKKVT